MQKWSRRRLGIVLVVLGTVTLIALGIFLVTGTSPYDAVYFGVPGVLVLGFGIILIVRRPDAIDEPTNSSTRTPDE